MWAPGNDAEAACFIGSVGVELVERLATEHPR